MTTEKPIEDEPLPSGDPENDDTGEVSTNDSGGNGPPPPPPVEK